VSSLIVLFADKIAAAASRLAAFNEVHAIIFFHPLSSSNMYVTHATCEVIGGEQVGDRCPTGLDGRALVSDLRISQLMKFGLGCFRAFTEKLLSGLLPKG
jgi:hypothetical protein